MKKFKLPKEFAEKWITALRSGNYKQIRGSLLELEDTNERETTTEHLEDCRFCCIGVAGDIGSIPRLRLLNHCLLDEDYFGEFLPNVPIKLFEIDDEFSGDPIDNKLTQVLVGLNDGVNKENYNNYFHLQGFVFRTQNIYEHDFEKKGKSLFALDFSQIADFIEDNCEFYTPEQP